MNRNERRARLSNVARAIRKESRKKGHTVSWKEAQMSAAYELEAMQHARDNPEARPRETAGE